MNFLRHFLLLILLATAARADDVLFFGNSFTYAEMAPLVKQNGGVPALFREIALAKGRQVATDAVTAGGQGWSYHLAQPATAQALDSKTWTWVVLQDFSTIPTQAGNVARFMANGETFSDRIAAKSPAAGIILYETWARPPGAFYNTSPGKVLGSPAEMMSQLHQSYTRLRDDLAARNPAREVRVALVGTAFARSEAENPTIVLDAADNHHATAEGYYLAALVIYDTIYHDSAKGAPSHFFNGVVKFDPDVAAKLQAVADEVAGGVAK